MAEAIVSLLTELTIYVVAWMIVHEAFYRLLPIPQSVKKLEEKEKDRKERDKTYAYYVSYFPALLHAPLTTIVSLWCLYYYGISYGKATQGWESFPIKYSCSFFIHDGIIGVYRGYNDNLFTLHHVVIVLVLLYSWYFNMYGSDMCNGIAQAIFDILTTNGFNEASIRPIGILFLASFIFIRTFVAPTQVWAMQQSEADLLFKIVYSGMWTISMMLIWMMINKIAKLLNQTFPTNTKVKTFYSVMVALRPYRTYYNVSIAILANTGIVHYYASRHVN